MKWTPDLLKEHLEERIAALNHRLDGFPQEYASSAEIDALRSTLESIRVDHVQRREIEELKRQHTRATEETHRRLDEGTGRRSATYALVGALAFLLIAMLGVVWKGELTSSDVRQQIATEAPWLKDKAQVEGQIRVLQGQVTALQIRVTQLETLSRFFCRTREKLLPGC